MNNPLYEHDCNSCTFLGTTDVGMMVSPGGKADWYGCLQGYDHKTIIARFSGEGPDYYSGWPYAYEGVPS